MPLHRRPILGAKSDEDGAPPAKTRDDRMGPGAVLARRAFGPETVELLLTDAVEKVLPAWNEP